MKTDFWDSTYYGGPLYDPFYKHTDDGESHAVNNALKANLKTEFESIGEPGTYGRFNLKNIQS
jgi:hypothetical protein